MGNKRACPEEWYYGLILLSCLELVFRPTVKIVPAIFVVSKTT